MLKDSWNVGLYKLFQQGEPMVFTKHEVILGNKSTPNCVYYLEKGYVKVYSISDDGSECIHVIWGPYEVFPLAWNYIGMESKLLFYETISDGLYWRISQDLFTQLIKTDLAVANLISEHLAKQFMVLVNRIDNLEYKRARERLVYRLLFLADRFGIWQHNSIVIDAPVTHDLLAGTINLARESVSREFEKLVMMGIVERRNRHITINDLPKLFDLLSEPVNAENWHLQKQMLHSRTW